jgi:hypothetical protein
MGILQSTALARSHISVSPQTQGPPTLSSLRRAQPCAPQRQQALLPLPTLSHRKSPETTHLMVPRPEDASRAPWLLSPPFRLNNPRAVTRWSLRRAR